jgi:hypothetical protein
MDLTGAKQYFSNRLNSQAWDNASEEDKQKAISTANMQLDSFRFKVDNTRFNYAIYEQAIWLLQGDKRAELQQSGVTSMTMSKLSESYSARQDPFIAPQAWYYLRGPSIKSGGIA